MAGVVGIEPTSKVLETFILADELYPFVLTALLYQRPKENASYSDLLARMARLNFLSATGSA